MDPFILPPLVHSPSPPSGPMHLPPALWEAEYMLIFRDGACPSLTPLYDGPYRVVQLSDMYFRLAISDREDSVSVARLKPLLADGPVVPALPRRRGRPPRLKPPPEPPVVPRCRGRLPRLKPPPKPPVVPRHRGRPKKDPPPAPSPAQLRRGRSAGLDPAHLGPQGLGGHVTALKHPVFKHALDL